MQVKAVPLPLEPFRLERYFAEHEFATDYLLGSSDCESMTVRQLLALEDAEHTFLDSRLGYTESRGAPALLGEITKLYVTIDASQILAHAGAEEAIYAFVRSVLAPGDRVVVQVPCYQSLEAVARSQGCEVVRWSPAEGPGWTWSLDELDALAPHGTRAIIVNSPHNPTGHQFSEQTFRAIARLADERNALLFSDEVYRLTELDGPPLPAACDLSANAVSLGVLSKAFGLAGLRIGWVASRNRATIEAMAAYKDYLTICNAGPSEFLATVALRQRDAVLGRVRNLLQHNRLLLGEFMLHHADRFEWTMPSAGPIAFVRLKGGSAEALCERAIRGGVMLVPSTQFDYGDAHVRIGYGRRNFPDALRHFKYVVDATS